MAERERGMKCRLPNISKARVRELFDYQPNTGVLVRKVTRGNRSAGRIVDTPSSKGYLRVLVDGKRYYAHQVVWVYFHDSWAKQIDHINGNKQDNRIENLRDVDTSTNCHNQYGPRKNNRLGVKGVHKIRSGKYRASCTVRGVKCDLGVFPTPESASVAYEEFKKGLK